MAEEWTLILGISHVFQKIITLKKKKKRQTKKGKAWEAPKHLFLMDGEDARDGEGREGYLGANPTFRSVGEKGQVWGA